MNASVICRFLDRWGNVFALQKTTDDKHIQLLLYMKTQNRPMNAIIKLSSIAECVIHQKTSHPAVARNPICRGRRISEKVLGKDG